MTMLMWTAFIHNMKTMLLYYTDVEGKWVCGEDCRDLNTVYLDACSDLYSFTGVYRWNCESTTNHWYYHT